MKSQKLSQNETLEVTMKLYYRESGSGPPVVLLHGLCLDHTIWESQILALGQSCRVITPDLTGMGKSGCTSGPRDFKQMAEDVVLLMDDLKIKQAVIAGFSLGGYVLLQLLNHHFSRVIAAAYISTRAKADSEEMKKIRTSTISELKSNGLKTYADNFVEKLFSQKYAASQPNSVKRTHQLVMSQDPQTVSSLLSAVRDREDFSEKVADFNIPSVVIGSDDDQTIPVDEIEQIAAQIPGSKLRIVTGAGHMTTLECPEVINDELNNLVLRIS